MELNGYLSSLQQALANATGTSSPEVQEAAERLAQTLEPALRLTLMELASDVASEVTLRLEGAVVEVRLRGGSPELVVEQQAAEVAEILTPPTPPEPPAPPLPEDDGSQTRITLRVTETLKSRIDDAAASDGVSVNAWLVRAVQQTLAGPSPTETRPSTSGRRMTGWVR
ncbi:toxin-antitoxin system HicB family antitoxin [Ruania halotolerans]|uniref:toxin-antitoxin system HicB family antitoxin n=1 Tax=Ruania halotolerans TaxID=2897773 RepID=UPI001E3BF037|nr:toxin-antitoxin system HicB family antitoxin [Ruania halotolerans]UFU07729.1 type II toxin-antitoxin system HicB family antitoxin [Ruania halotolerans]